MRKKSKLFFSSLIIMLIYLTFITPSIYASTAKDYIVNTKKSNSSLVITDKKLLEKAIKQLYDGESQKNLLEVLNDGTFMKIQDEYNVNAVFAIAVATVESSCGTSWGMIPSSTYNWMSVQGSYNGKSVPSNGGGPLNWRDYESFSEATLDFGNCIANTPAYYFKAGNYSVKQMARIYYSEETAEVVANQMTKIYNATKNIYGDVNLDGKVNMKDAAAVSAYLKDTSKLSSVQLKLADVNGDGKVTDIDQSLIIGKYMGTIKYFPIEVKYGDIDGDGKISKTDAELVANYVQGKKKLTATQLALADVNATGKVNAKDAQLILQRAQGLIVAFPIESDSNVALSTESSVKIITTARDVLRNMINKKITYGAQTWQDIKKTSEEDTLYVSSTYVSVVLYNSGLLTENQINSYNYNDTGPGGIPDMLKAAGWTQVKPSEARAGDIINVYGGHLVF